MDSTLSCFPKSNVCVCLCKHLLLTIHGCIKISYNVEPGAIIANYLSGNAYFRENHAVWTLCDSFSLPFKLNRSCMLTIYTPTSRTSTCIIVCVERRNTRVSTFTVPRSNHCPLKPEPINTRDDLSHLSWEGMQIVTFPTEDKSQMLVCVRRFSVHRERALHKAGMA